MCKVSQYTSTYSLHILDMCKDKYVLKTIGDAEFIVKKTENTTNNSM